MTFMFSLFDCITRSSSLSLEEMKLIATVYWIFQELDFLRLLISSKYGLISLRYSLIDGVLFLSALLSYPI